ncbi:MAG: DUF6588 family protein [Reichenbachiella sp.]|uniref:DUF6588 family protein n=1 Tax=Reichenbachiella sp. TaxID=2184521 RepID=UPI0032667BEF
MELNFTRRMFFVCLCVGICLPGSMYGQITSLEDAEALDISVFLKGGEEAASELMGLYLNPAFTGMGFGVANGWYNTAKPHKPLGFDITATLSLAKTPNSDLFFSMLQAGDITSGGIRTQSGNTEEFATVFGDDRTVGLESSLTQNGITVTSQFNAPPGLNLEDDVNGYVPVPMLQAGIGLIKNTDLKIRWVPTQKSDEDGYELKMFGLGVMHDFKQWIPGIKHIPIDMSVLVAFNRINAKLDLTNDAVSGAGQEGEFGINAWTYQVLVSKKLSILTLYGGFGFNNVSTSLEVKGSYDIQDDTDSNLVITLVDPVSESFTSSGMRATAGFRLKLAIITLHADYTLQKYNTITAGLGFSFR